MKQQVSKILWGIVLVALGVIYALKALGIADINLFFKGWWTLFIIIPSAIGIITDNDKTGGIIGLFVGLFLLLGCRGYVDFKLIGKLIFPAIIILIGLKMIFGNVINKKSKDAIKSLKNTTGMHTCSAIFSNKKDDLTNMAFTGAEYTTFLGKIDSDLSMAFFERDVLIKTKNIFGNTVIAVPEGVNVKTISHSLFGGVNNPIRNDDANVITIYVEAYCVFGDVKLWQRKTTK